MKALPGDALMPTEPERGFEKLLERLRFSALDEGPHGLSDGQLLQRFCADRDAGAFEELIRRHGRVVMFACRRQLREPQDVEDCYQAVWLILARKAGSIRRPELLAGWLYGVAHRTALEARATATRRRNKERQAARPEAVEPDRRAELWELIDKELTRLPSAYRAAVLLCDVEGLSYKEAARRLGWPEGTLAGRLSRARATLATRLSRQGIIVTSGTLVVALARQADAAGAPLTLAASTAQAAVMFASSPGTIPATVLPSGFLLAQEVLKVMHITKLKIAAVLLFAALAVAGVGGGILSRMGTNDAESRAEGGQVDPAKPGDAAGKTDKPAPAAAVTPRTTRDVEEKLSTALSLDLKDKPLTTAVEDFRKLTGVNLIVDWKSLMQQGLVDSPVTLRVERVSARSALRLILRDTDLGYYIDDGMLVLVPLNVSREKMVRRIYPVADLVGADQKADNLIEVITQMTGPDSWMNRGGMGAIVYFVEGRCLIVNQVTDVHEEIQQLLEELRTSRPVQKSK
jgi:RNA polymerase sigma factor (sigma-70 family)